MRLLATQLVGARGISSFNAGARETTAAFFEAALPKDEAADLFDCSRLEGVLSGPGAPSSQADIYSNEHLVRLADILHRSGRRPADVAAEQLRKGSTLRFRDIDRFDARLADFASAVAETYAAETHINVYLTPPRQEGFPPHFDNTDAFIVQVAGSKDFLIHPQYTNQKPLPNADTAWDPQRYRPIGAAETYTLRVGDVLYIPRGVMHSARSREEESMHLTVSLAPLTLAALLEREVRRLAEEEEALRRRAPWSTTGDAGEPEGIRGHLRHWLCVLGERLDPSLAIAEQRERLGPPSSGANVLGEAVASLKRP